MKICNTLYAVFASFITKIVHVHAAHTQICATYIEFAARVEKDGNVH